MNNASTTIAKNSIVACTKKTQNGRPPATMAQG
jgi:hypothetical protein